VNQQDLKIFNVRLFLSML